MVLQNAAPGGRDGLARLRGGVLHRLIHPGTSPWSYAPCN